MLEVNTRPLCKHLSLVLFLCVAAHGRYCIFITDIFTRDCQQCRVQDFSHIVRHRQHLQDNLQFSTSLALKMLLMLYELFLLLLLHVLFT
jgi:hypothetical protein